RLTRLSGCSTRPRNVTSFLCTVSPRSAADFLIWSTASVSCWSYANGMSERIEMNALRVFSVLIGFSCFQYWKTPPDRVRVERGYGWCSQCLALLAKSGETCGDRVNAAAFLVENVQQVLSVGPFDRRVHATARRDLAPYVGVPRSFEDDPPQPHEKLFPRLTIRGEYLAHHLLVKQVEGHPQRVQ